MLGRRVSACGHDGNGSEPKARRETSYMVLVSNARDHQPPIIGTGSLEVEPRVGLEPTTCGLRNRCSTS